ncbi:3'-5' exonuclease [Litchfieldia alkalitelluris]|uniref:3'-5' exonuclease n=1 Tax=Litchfieldia alkalitelluris TaxID=304268 RepID=UPI000995E7FA|nr:3'-5' exonuclease [Litchfieldia alkalitelluris]
MATVKQYVFFDFEMLCSNRGMTFTSMESIRLGAVKYDIKTEEIQYFDQYIRPNQLKPLSPFCKQLTGISDDDLVDANNFSVVFELFLDWVGGIKKTRFFSWSKSDLCRLKIDAEQHQISPATISKIEKRYIDFQAIFSKRVTKNQYSVENALQLYGLDFIGEKHNPMYDAFNTLRIYLSFLNQPLKSDLIMLNQFIFNDNEEEIKKHDLNSVLNKYIEQDINYFSANLSDVYNMKDFSKTLKSTRKIVEKYENIICNRSGIFSKDTINIVRKLLEFYHELLLCYQEHSDYSSKVIILNEQTIQPILQLSLKRG